MADRGGRRRAPTGFKLPARAVPPRLAGLPLPFSPVALIQLLTSQDGADQLVGQLVKRLARPLGAQPPQQSSYHSEKSCE